MINVASFAEAWIENVMITNTPIKVVIVASFAEAWIENMAFMCSSSTYSVASFAEAWIEN